jgi:hypothetical protein
VCCRVDGRGVTVWKRDRSERESGIEAFAIRWRDRHSKTLREAADALIAKTGYHDEGSGPRFERST